MAATCHSMPEETLPTAPYSLAGALKTQLSALSALVDCLHAQLQSSEDANNP